MYNVKDAAKLSGLSSHTTCYYCDRNIVSFVSRDKNNNRVFEDDSIKSLIAIKHFRNVVFQ